MPVSFFDVDSRRGHQYIDSTVSLNDALGHFCYRIAVCHIEHFNTHSVATLAGHFFQLLESSP